jgi:simple sugar transport system ATP-binding protein
VRSAAEVPLALDHLSKRFGTTQAIDDVSFALRRGTVHALLGENGAGKTTLMRAAFGLIHPDAGDVRAFGRPIRSTHDAIAAGLGMVHQHFSNVPAMTVAENVALGGAGRYDARAAAARVEQIAESSGLRLDPNTRAGSLPVSAQQRLEIVKALAHGARVLILDEPTAVLAPDESRRLLRWLRAFADGGSAVVLITHKLRDAIDLADDITVLRSGRRVLSTRASDVAEVELTRAVLGEELSPTPPVSNAVIGDIVASLDGVTVFDGHAVPMLRDVSLNVRAGEIVGVAAVEGAGSRELLRVLAGRAAPSRGHVRIPSRVGFIPEDRQRDALMLELDPRENVALRDAGERRGIVPWDAIASRSQRLIERFDVRGATLRRPVSTLSGGNQQKLVLARELEDAPALVVAENPTRGLDVRAAQEVRARIEHAAANGAAVVFYSTDLDEVLAMARRVVVLHAGVLGEAVRDRDAVGRAMLGLS